jgi:hypothetical protein
MRAQGLLPGKFLERLAALEVSYLAEGDPIRQSGFGGGPRRWRAERDEPPATSPLTCGTQGPGAGQEADDGA